MEDLTNVPFLSELYLVLINVFVYYNSAILCSVAVEQVHLQDQERHVSDANFERLMYMKDARWGDGEEAGGQAGVNA